MTLKVPVQRSSFAGEKLFVTLVKHGFHTICAIPNDRARKSTFSTVPLAPDLLLDSQNRFHLFNSGSCAGFGILLQVNTSLMLLHLQRGLDPSHLIPFPDNRFQVSNPPVKPG